APVRASLRTDPDGTSRHADAIRRPLRPDRLAGARQRHPAAHEGASVSMLCLVDRRSSQASVVEWTGSPSPADAAAPAPIVVPLAAAPAAVVVAQEPGEPASIGSYSVRLYRDLSVGDYADGLIRPRDG